MEPNVTNQTTLGGIKWSSWIDSGTPLPTPETSAYGNVVGAFEGAKYTPIGNYRPRLRCMMRSLSDGFCEVCTETHIVRLYATPGVGTIGEAFPDPGFSLEYGAGRMLAFSVTPSLACVHSYQRVGEVDVEAGESSDTFMLNTAL